MKNLRIVGAFAGLLLLASCGGEGSGGAGGSGSGDRTPTFTNPSTFTIQENTGLQTAAVVQLTATGGTSLTFTIEPGKDSAQFVFLGTVGNLAFASPPSFETPLDANHDNVYEVDVGVSNGAVKTIQTIRVTITNSAESLAVNRVATGLGQNGSLIYLAGHGEVLTVSQAGVVSRVTLSSGAVSSPGTIGGLAVGAEVLDVVAEDLNYRAGHFFALVREGRSVSVFYVQASNPSLSSRVWQFNFGAGTGPVEASMAMYSNNAMIALGDGGNEAAAQDPADLRGNILVLGGNGAVTDLATYAVTPRTIGWGLHSPRLPSSSDTFGRVIDRGELFNELSQGTFQMSQSVANFEWPILDGRQSRGFTGLVQGTRISPTAVQALGSGGTGPGRWLDGATGLQGNPWVGVYLLSDDQGNLYTFDPTSGRMENRTGDFQPDAGTITRIVSMDDSDRDAGVNQPIFMLDSDGELFRASVL